MEEIKYIPINIWDDFYDDGYVPEGEKVELNFGWNFMNPEINMQI